MNRVFDTPAPFLTLQEEADLEAADYWWEEMQRREARVYQEGVLAGAGLMFSLVLAVGAMVGLVMGVV